MDAEQVRRMISMGESQTVEFKLSIANEESFARVLSAFANSEGGTLLVGINDKGEIVGLSAEETHRTINLLRKIVESLLPYPIEIDVVNIDGRNIVYVVIPPAPTEYSPILTSRGELFERRGGSSARIQEPEKSKRLVLGDIHPLPHHRRNCKVFVAMSFRTEQEPALVDYYRAMERASRTTGLPIMLHRIDLQEGDYEISQQIMHEIEQSDFVIADFTLNPPNVYYEVGYAKGNQKEVIRTARTGTPLEFDARNWRTIFYRNATELEERLVPALRAAYGGVFGELSER